MPVIDSEIIADVRSKIDSTFGPIPSQLSPGQQSAINNQRQNLAICIAESGIYTRDNNVVNPGQSVTDNVVSSPGTWS